MLCKAVCPCCRMLVLLFLLLILCAVLIYLHCALLVSSLAITVRLSSACVMLSFKNSSLLSRRHRSVLLTDVGSSDGYLKCLLKIEQTTQVSKP